MKHLIFKLAIFSGIVALILISYFTQPSAEINKSANNVTTAVRDTQYHIGAFDNGWYSQYNYLKDSLKFNVWHNYSALENGWEMNPTDNYLQPIPSWVSDIVRTNKDSSMRTYMDRPIIQYIVAGQRVDYECEQIPSSDPYWFYAFTGSVNGTIHVNDTTDNDPRYGNGERVKRCKIIEQYPVTSNVLIDSGVISDRELSSTETNKWNSDNAWDWYVMPRMRIDSSYAAGTQHNGDTVCIIQITGWYGQIVKEIPIRVRNFKEFADGTYHGNYLDTFYFTQGQENLNISKSLLRNFIDTTDATFFAYSWWKGSGNDIKIFWTGKCDMWIDRVRLENVPAHQYLTLKNPYWIDRVNTEITLAKANQKEGIPNYLYFEECEFSHFQAIKALNKQIMDSSSNTISLVIWLNYDMFREHIPGFPVDNRSLLNAEQLKKYLYTDFGLRTIVMGSYALEGFTDQDVNDWSFRSKSYHPNTLFGYEQRYNKNAGILSYFATPEFYDNWLQTHIDTGRGGTKLNYINKLMDSLSKISDMRIINCPQAHLWHSAGHKLKEPSNEELELQTCLGITYNAKGTMFFSYTSFNPFDSLVYARGIINSAASPNYCEPRHISVYHQDKFKKIGQINSKLQKWGPYIMKFVATSTLSCSYRLMTERENFLSSTYFMDIVTFKPGSGEPPCVAYSPGFTLPSGLTYDCNEYRYLQAATFKTSASDINKYFMIVNRRCSPYIDESTIDNRGGKRNIRVKFDLNSNDFAGYENWEIFCIDSNKTVATFGKSAGTLIDLGWYMPGQGELYKISPVILGGGTLVADEVISGNVNCNGMIYNGGHNITISPNAVVTFSDSAGIEMNGGCFVSGINADNADAVTLTGKSSNTFWKGITLIGCDSIGVYNTNISNIKANDTAKAFSIINSYKVNFRRNTINANSNSGGIQAVYNSFSYNPIVFNVRECTFNMNQSGYSAISVLSNASVTLPIVTEWCLFNSQNDTSNAILFSEVTGGAIKNNNFTNFGKSVVLMYSTTDFYGNTILGKDNSQGILCLSGSYASLSPTSGQYFGGYNYIKNYGTTASNVYSNNSYFNINNGQNDFDLSDIDNSKHLTGDLSGMPYSYVNATKNCFHKDSITNVDATHSVVWYDNSLVNFIFTDYSCELTPPGDYFVYQYGGYNDTVYYSPGGEGSGFNPNKPMNIEENVYKSLKDSININLRKRNYLTVEDKAKQLLTQYPDSLESAAMVQKLYMASLSLDSTKIGLTKTFLENLISANTQNPTLIKRAFYFIQKCKVKLGQYQSALDGFQYIMTQNPYTYEGLVASWDYAATYLLMGTGGSYKGELGQTTEELNTPADTLLSRMTKSDINTNKSKNTNSNRNSTEQITKTFYEKIKNVTKDDKTAQEEKVKTLEKKIETTKSKNEKSDAITELATMKQIKEVVKLKKPNTIVTHTAIINNDIKKVFGIGKGNKDESTNSLIPQTYTLYQNYPNPFNPTTKIAYDIPRDAKVKLVIYDILGREMKTLVNNEFRSAGKYITEFNGSNLASGIYFARILVNEGKDFMAVKKMVLVK
jgi:hypothetical protein